MLAFHSPEAHILGLVDLLITCLFFTHPFHWTTLLRPVIFQINICEIFSLSSSCLPTNLKYQVFSMSSHTAGTLQDEQYFQFQHHRTLAYSAISSCFSTLVLCGCIIECFIMQSAAVVVGLPLDFWYVSSYLIFIDLMKISIRFSCQCASPSRVPYGYLF